MGKKSSFNEATRVQMPALVHLSRIGYNYYGKISESERGTEYDGDTNILLKVFRRKFCEFNPTRAGEFDTLMMDIRKELDDDDLGRQFYKRICSVEPMLIDFEHPERNEYDCTAEFTCANGEDNFRPDITLFINGLPLAFVEVKMPNNPGGMLAESNRMTHVRFPNKKFRRFMNITQLMIFSNNMEYDAEGGVVPIEGVFYCTAAREKGAMNCFREENPHRESIAPYNADYPYRDINPMMEQQILIDFNNTVIKHTPEYASNLDINSPTNRVLTSMCSPERLLFLIKYGIAYVKQSHELKDGTIEDKDEKHIMRYQQMFAALAIREQMGHGVKSGIVWHTQGSGKTALSYYLTYVLKDMFAKQHKVTKFYFIVDRLDLLEQASKEFKMRGLKVTTADSRKELMAQFREQQSLNGMSGDDEITVVNIQRFENDTDRVELPKYATQLQRIFILDEAHRGYKPNGCFLANLFNADPDAIKIALTGTPLLGEERGSCKVFGNYLHTYYYDRSIQDGYTLKIIREEIESSYRKRLNDVYDTVEHLVQKGEVTKPQVVEHETFVKELLRFIISDLALFRVQQGDESLGGMVICETSEQARRLYKFFDEIQTELNAQRIDKLSMRAGLILYDSDDKESRKQVITDFKENYKVDILIVFNMLLTGFDAKRLKRLYFGRKMKDHNLLQAITRVNRPYKDMRRGFLIDFADIKQNFDQTNEAYLRELNRYNDAEDEALGGEVKLPDMYAQVMEDQEALVNQMKEVKEILFDYDTTNMEEFSKELSMVEDRKPLLALRNALLLAKDATNLVKSFGDETLRKKFAEIEVGKIPEMLREVTHRIGILNQKEAFVTSEATQMAVNVAMMNIEFNFSKIGEDELRIIDGGSDLQEGYHHVVKGLSEMWDKEDPEYIALAEALRQVFKKHHFYPEDMAQYNEDNKAMADIVQRMKQLQHRNEVVRLKYNGDTKYAVVHKRICEENKRRAQEHKLPIISQYESEVVAALLQVKEMIDSEVYKRSDILRQDAYFEKLVLQQVALGLDDKGKQAPTMEDYTFIQKRIAKQYLNQYHQR